MTLTLADIGHERFESLFGRRRGTGEAARTSTKVRPSRQKMFAALTKAGLNHSTVPLTMTSQTRYVAVARSEHSDNLHIVGLAGTLTDAVRALQSGVAADFAPECVMDLDTSEAACLFSAWLSEAGRVVVGSTAWALDELV